MILALDPGLRCCGVAVFGDQRLVRVGCPRGNTAGLRDAVAWREMAAAVCEWAGALSSINHVYLEKPQVYRGSRAGNPDDLLQLVGVLGAVVGRFPSTRFTCWTPREWKGQLKKAPHHARIKAALTPEELTTLGDQLVDVPPELRHNAWDAVGLGLVAVGRMRKPGGRRQCT